VTTAAHAAPRERQPIPWRKILAPVRAIPALIKPAGPTIRSATLQISGLAAITYAAWQCAEPAGYAVGGVALFVINWLMTDPPPPVPGERR
jgi:hypothetical protein